MSAIEAAITKAYNAIRDRSVEIAPTRWQSMDVSKRKEATTREVLNHTLQAPIHTESVDELARCIGPNLPWADDHFLERVGGLPLNPGETWRTWPWGNSAANFRPETVPAHHTNPSSERLEATATAPERVNYAPGFHHTYAERMWPKRANQHVVIGGEYDGTFVDEEHHGVRYKYGDARDVVEHLAKHPDSRQAYLPIWFPEDTGKTDVRVPCTLGYHFIHRNGYLHCTYYIRSCDLYRHFRDDVYLTVRLQLWMLDQLRHGQGAASPVDWVDVKPGLFTMHIVSLHCFINDAHKLWPGHTWR